MSTRNACRARWCFATTTTIFSGPAYFDRQLDLFHNKLRTSGHALPGLPPTPAVVLYSSGQSAQLGLATSALPTEAEFDIALEQTDNTPMTLAFPHDPFGLGQSPRARSDQHNLSALTYLPHYIIPLQSIHK